MAPEEQRIDWKSQQAKIRLLINSWDPIGVADTVEDEYEWLIPTLWTQLHRGASRSEISEYLRFEVRDRVGLNPVDLAIDQLADRLVALATDW